MTLVSFAAAYQNSSWQYLPMFELVHGTGGTQQLRAFAGTATADISIDGTLIPRLIDHHVHLGLVDPAELLAGGITQAIDLGWDPHVAKNWTGLSEPVTTIAGALLTCVGGYPKNAGWGPPSATMEVAEPEHADAAVAAQQAAGASVVKITMNSDAGPVPSDALLSALIVAAQTRGMPVYVHSQGFGQAQRAFAAGADVFAHAPFSEVLPDALVTAMAARGVRWVSTLHIHGWGSPTREHQIAIDNIRRFTAAGGRVLYGTDAGNGPLTVGVNAHELAELVDTGVDLLSSITTAAPGERDSSEAGAPASGVAAVVPGVPPSDTDALPDWLGTATGVSVESFEREGLL